MTSKSWLIPAIRSLRWIAVMPEICRKPIQFDHISQVPKASEAMPAAPLGWMRLPSAAIPEAMLSSSAMAQLWKPW